MSQTLYHGVMSISIKRLELTNPLRAKLGCTTCGGTLYLEIPAGDVHTDIYTWGTEATFDNLNPIDVVAVLAEAIGSHYDDHDDHHAALTGVGQLARALRKDDKP